MQRVYSCLTGQHDLRLVFLAGLICVAACLISMNLFIRANDAERNRALSWLFVAATVFGAGVWATHFISELAYEPGFPISYDAGLTALSFVAAIGAAWFGMFVAHRFAAPMLGGAMIGAGIAAMHYIGMAALRAPAQLHWDAGYVLASGAIAMTCAAAAMRALAWRPVLRGRLVAVVLLVLAIVGLHFTAMAAVTLVPDPLIAVPGHVVAPTVLAVLIATVTALIAGLGLLGLIVDKHLALRNAREAERLRRSEDHLARAQRIAHTGSIEQDLRTGAIVWSGETYRIFGLDPKVPAPMGEAFLALFHPDDRAACETQGPAHQAAAAGQLSDKPRVDLHFRIVQPGGAVRRVHHESELVLDQHGAAVRWIGTYRDVTEAYEAEARIAHMAHHDALTGLPNRVLFHDHLEHALLGVRRYNDTLAVLYLDLDHFKNVNDGLGHPAGDKLLQAVAERLRACLRISDMVARFGGDEFAVLQIGLAGPHEAGALADRIVTLLSEPYDIDGQLVEIGASVGIALAPIDGETAEQLLANADVALYQAKEDGRRTYCFFQPDMGASVQAHHLLALDLRNALGAGELEVYYQPLVTLATGVISGFEALLRWHHPLHGMVAPAKFIPLAEETGLIIPIGEWVLRQACAEAAAWPDDLKVAVNLSPVQFKRGNLPQVVFATLASSGLPARRLELEITESVFLAESKTNLATLRSLRALGVGISMDDFGTGYSGLSYLRAFPFDKIKIDRSFISAVGEGADCMAIIKAITTLGWSLGIPTLAEGVETKKQLAWVRAAGCTEMQGYLFSRPIPASEIAGLLSSQPNCRQADKYLLTA
jgi:diguanylate cyclase (GGDEF)-like protein